MQTIVFANRQAAFDAFVIERIRNAEALSIGNVEVYRLSPGAKFNLESWTGTGGIGYTISAKAGQLISSRGDIY